MEAVPKVTFKTAFIIKTKNMNQRIRLHLSFILIILLSGQFAFAQGYGNPIVRDIYTADPSAHVWADGRLYVYPSHDIAPPRGCDFMDKYHIYSTDDMVNWVDHGQILEASQVPWAQPLADGGKFMWAPDCAYKNGKYYYYFPHPDKDPWNSNWKIGIAVSDKPASDFTVLDQPLIGPPPDGQIDPCVFIDDDGQAYFYYGGGGRCYGAKLKDNMIELDGNLQPMTGLYDFHEATWVFKRNGIYYLTYADGNSGGNQLRYAISNNPLGPWSHKGVYLKPQTADTSHGSVVEYKGQWWAFYHTADLSGNGALRSICVDKLFFNDDGTIQTVVQTKDMGTPYLDIMRTTDEPIEAEDYNSGGQGFAYWSNNTSGYNSGVLRKNENIVIMQNRPTQIYYVTNTSDEKYINYTFEVPEDGVYTIDFTIGAVSSSSEVQFYIGFDWIKSTNPRRYVAPYATAANLPVVTVPDITLTKGIHTLNFYPQGNMNFDKFTVVTQGAGIHTPTVKSIKVYPNPTGGVIYFQLPSATGTVHIADLTGRNIYSQIVNSRQSIDISGVSPGIYILTLQSGNQVYQKKLIKK